ncbi:MAG: bacillithiol biosynthesis cysteine-adding enzyme BshC [Chitinophagaceae bacterium]
MKCTSTRIPYRQTGVFSRMAMDYIDQAETLRPYFAHPVNLSGIQKAIEERKKFTQDRAGLVRVLKQQYEGVETSSLVKKNIDSLLSPDTFTITTAHQNNIFTGPLYFIYKIIHAIRLADQLNEQLAPNRFVPVFYIGSEDADIEELNHIYLAGEKLTWNTTQTGAVGRMKIDKALLELIRSMEGQLAVLPAGEEIITALKTHYREGQTIAGATFGFINFLFSEMGLVILQPDNADLKRMMIPLFEDELINQTASGLVAATTENLEACGYRVQAHPREINLFYLDGDKRERITREDGRFRAKGTDLDLDENGIRKLLSEQPGFFSPNVITRGLYQETILPNLAFIGGAGETAYWLQLKDLFTRYQVPFPVLVLRNSFLLVEPKWQEAARKLGFTEEDLFLSETELMNRIVTRESSNPVVLKDALKEMEGLYDSVKTQAMAVDLTLGKHVEALRARALQRLRELEKKMLRAEKRKYSDQQRQIRAIREQLFPGNGLQERKDNFTYFYAKTGKDFLRNIYEHSLTLEQEFVILNMS